jgi:hypothetical protein
MLSLLLWNSSFLLSLISLITIEYRFLTLCLCSLCNISYYLSSKVVYSDQDNELATKATFFLEVPAFTLGRSESSMCPSEKKKRLSGRKPLKEIESGKVSFERN